MNRINWAYAVALVGALAAIAVLFLAAQWLPEAKRGDLLFEGAKVAIGVLPLVLFSVIINELVRRRDEHRQVEQRRDDFRRRFLSDVVIAYNKTKAVRRQLRGAGIRPTTISTFTPEQLTFFDAQLTGLSDTQLDLERLKREAQSRSKVFTNSDAIRDALRDLESYVNNVVKEWEGRRGSIAVGIPLAEMASWTQFSAFVASKGSNGNFDTAASQMRTIEEGIWPDLVASGA